MKRESAKSSSTATSAPRNGESSKLVSLLALATGAVAIPQTGNADIIYTDLSSSPVTTGYGNSYTISTLPGTATLTFETRRTSTYFSIRYSQTLIGAPAGGLAGLQVGVDNFALHRGKGAAWANQSLYANVAVAIAASYANGPASYGQIDHEYLAFGFYDTTAGNAFRYGWLEVSMANAPLHGGFAYPTLTIYGYAYDNTGAKLAMGDGVPEPSSAAVLALGAMALGAKGLRAWRRKQGAAK
jgi:hypothetical protein